MTVFEYASVSITAQYSDLILCTVSDTFRKLFILVYAGILNHIPHYYSIFTHSDALLRYVQAYSCIFTALCIPRIFTMYSWYWHIYNRRHIQNPLKLWPDIFRTVYSDIIRHTQRCVTLVYAETWHIRNPEIFRTLS